MSDAEIDAAARLLREGAREAAAASTPASRAALTFVLVSPQFLFRVEQRPGQRRAAASIYRISDLELASRLSFFLWSSIPDDELLDAGDRRASCRTARCSSSRSGGCSRTSARARSAATSPASGCTCATCAGLQPDADVFPDFDDNLREALQRETELLFESVVREDRSVLDAADADYTFVNERLARHYGIPNVYGDAVPAGRR